MWEERGTHLAALGMIQCQPQALSSRKQQALVAVSSGHAALPGGDKPQASPPPYIITRVKRLCRSQDRPPEDEKGTRNTPPPAFRTIPYSGLNAADQRQRVLPLLAAAAAAAAAAGQRQRRGSGSGFPAHRRCMS